MPVTAVRVFQDADGVSPFLTWLNELEKDEPDAYAKCVHLILALHQHGHQLRRPMADALRDGIHELRARKGRVHYRILYGFYGRHAAVLCHGVTKEDRVDANDIDLAAKRLVLVKKNAERYTADLETEE